MNDLNDIVDIVLQNAIAAADQQTFGVAGALVDNASGELLHVLHNNVLKSLSDNTLFTFDPTAHGERQLVYWYYENKEELRLPPPSDVTVITSLDPCLMCTGCLLAAGFKVGVVAMDEFAGINFDSTGEFNSLPATLQLKAKESFGYYAIESTDETSTLLRDYKGPTSVKFYNNTLSPDTLLSCGDVFSKSLESVRDVCNNLGIPPIAMTNPLGLPDTSPIKMASRILYPDAFTVTTLDPRTPCDKVKNELEKVVTASPTSQNSVAVIDPFGNIVLCMADTFDVSPVHTAFMNATQAYAQLRWRLIEEFDLTRDEVLRHLAHPKHCTYVYLNAPDPDSATTIMELGAFGSSMEGQIPDNIPPNLQYYNPPLNGTSEGLQSIISKLPPFYRKYTNVQMKSVLS